MQLNNLKLSIIIENTSNKNIDRTIDSLLKQSYKNIEIFVIGGEKNSFYDDNQQIQFIEYSEEMSLFQTILSTSNLASGDYITFLSSKNYVSVDFYREMLRKCNDFNWDIVVGNTVLENTDGNIYLDSLAQLHVDLIKDGKIFDNYFRQEGLNKYWSNIFNKIYSISLWKKAITYFYNFSKKIFDINDFVISTTLFFFAESITQIENGVVYVADDNYYDVDYDEFLNDLNDNILGFSIVELFLKDMKVFNKYKKNFSNWKHLYSLTYRDNINNCLYSSDDKEKLLSLVDSFCDNREKIEDSNFFYSHKVVWDDRLEQLKLAIVNPDIKVVSFDIFDTLVVRPFFKPLDLFKMLDNDYRDLKNCSNGISFSKMRVISEAIARSEQEKKDSSIQEITLDDIYRVLNKLYGVEKKHLDIMKKKEQDAEVKFCTVRHTAFELYELALSIGKKVICTSDMYLDEKTIFNILRKNGYTNISKLYLSSNIKKTKSTGDLYSVVLNDLEITSSEMIHIGDNFQSDYEMAKKIGINSFHFIKALDVMLDDKYTNSLTKMFTKSFPFWQDNIASLNYFGIRVMLGVVANRYFDNPYKTFDKNTDFNADPFLIGYYALGMYQFGIGKWLVSNLKGKYDKISFMARDGFLAMESYKLFKKLYDDLPDEEYIYVSRKSLMPIMIMDKYDFYKLSDLVSYDSHSPQSIIKYLTNILDIDIKKLQKICKTSNIKFDEKFSSIEEFNIFIKLLVDNFYDEKIHKRNREKLRKYFDNLLGKRPAVFDVGYSGRPEFYLSELLDRNVDTFFLNINKDEALEYSSLGKFNINTFFQYKPVATGNLYEHIISKNAPSCISYNLSGDSVVAEFEEYKNTYQVEYMIEIMQDAALSFINDLINIYGKDIEMLYYQDYYVTLPIMAYFNSANMLDKLVFKPVIFEDDIGKGTSVRVIDNMYKDLESKNQQLLKNLEHSTYVLDKSNVNFDYDELVKLTSNDNLKYNPIVDLNKHNRFSRLVYYLLFDRNTLYRRVDGILYRIKRKIKRK